MPKSPILIALLAIASTAFAEDWPAWRGPRGDGIVKATIESLPSEPKELWRKTVGLGFATPVAADGRVYSFMLSGGPVEALFAFDAATGADLWKQEYKITWTGPVPKEMTSGWKGTRASPVVENGRIYTLGSYGDLIARDVKDGKPLWHINVLKETGASEPITWGCSSNLLIDGDLVIVQGGIGGAVAAAINNTGQLAWKGPAGLAGYAQPIIAAVGEVRKLIILGGDTLFALNPADGKQIWTYPWVTKFDVNAATPVYRDGHLFITSAYDHGAMMLRVSATSAKPAWDKVNKEVMCRFQPPILDGNVLLANSEGTVKCLSWPEIKPIWTATDRISPGGSLLRAGDNLLMLTERGKLILARATPEKNGYQKLGEAKPLEGMQIRSAPAVYNGKLYLKGTEELVCYDLTAKN